MDISNLYLLLTHSGAQKNEAKKGRPCGGLAQRKSFVEIVRQKVACTVEMP